MRDLGAGFGYLVKGQRWFAAHRGSYGLGLLPGLVALVLYLGVLTALALWGGDFASWATPFADDWGWLWRRVFRGFLTALLFALALILSVLTFTAVTLLLGQPFYEKLSERVDRAESPDGTAPESGLPLLRELWISARDGLRILVRAGLWGLLLVACGLVPVLGQTVVPVVGLMVTGFFLTEELTSIALQRRGMELADRLDLLRSRKRLIWGFGTPLAVCFLVPFLAVFLMPGAVAGATLLVRHLLGEDREDRPADRAHPDPYANGGTGPYAGFPPGGSAPGAQGPYGVGAPKPGGGDPHAYGNGSGGPSPNGGGPRW